MGDKLYNSCDLIDKISCLSTTAWGKAIIDSLRFPRRRTQNCPPIVGSTSEVVFWSGFRCFHCLARIPTALVSVYFQDGSSKLTGSSFSTRFRVRHIGNSTIGKPDLEKHGYALGISFEADKTLGCAWNPPPSSGRLWTTRVAWTFES